MEKEINPKYLEIKEHLKNVLKTAKKLGLNVIPGGGYTMGYDLNNLPPYPVGLFGALSIVEGPGSRCKLGLTFDETQSLEAGFNYSFPAKSNKRKKLNQELVNVGIELNGIVQTKKTKYHKTSNNASMAWEAFSGAGLQGVAVVGSNTQPKTVEDKKKILEAVYKKLKLQKLPDTTEEEAVLQAALSNKEALEQILDLAEQLKAPTNPVITFSEAVNAAPDLDFVLEPTWAPQASLSFTVPANFNPGVAQVAVGEELPNGEQEYTGDEEE